MAEAEYTNKGEPRPLPEYIPPTIAEELQNDLAEYAEYADMSEELGLLKRIAFCPEMEGIYRTLGRRFSLPLDWSLFYSNLVTAALDSELFKDIKQSRAEFERRKQQARRGLRDLIDGLDWITDTQELHGFSIDFREDLRAHLYGVFAASIAGKSVPARKDIDPREFLSTCRTILAILEDPTRQRDSFREQTSGTVPRTVFVRRIARHLQKMAAPGSSRLLSHAELATLARVVFDQTEPDKNGVLFGRDHVREALKGMDY